jgi:hypothetical protein
MRKHRRREEQHEREAARSGEPLARLDTATRAGVLQELQRAGGNRAVQDVVTGAQLQRDVAAEAQKASSPKGRLATAVWALSVDGTVVGRARSVEGGSMRSEVVTESGPGQRKHIGPPRYDPFVVEVGLGVGKAFLDWIRSAVARTYDRRELILHQLDGATGQEQAQLLLKDALVSAVEVPQLTAAETSPVWLRVTIATDTVHRSPGSGVKLDTKPAAGPLDPSTLRLEVSGIGPVSDLRSVAPWRFKQDVTLAEVGRTGGPYHREAKSEFGNLLLTLVEGAKGSGSGIAALDAWAQDFIIGGNARSENERNAVLTVSSQGGRKLVLGFSGVGIVSADQLARPDGGRRYELYVESATFGVS